MQKILFLTLLLVMNSCSFGTSDNTAITASGNQMAGVKESGSGGISIIQYDSVPGSGSSITE